MKNPVPIDAYVLILNWNGWIDTVRCLATVLAMEGAKFKVIICDNGSEDQSVEKIKEWCEGRLEADLGTLPHDLVQHIGTKIKRPVAYAEHSIGDNEQNTRALEPNVDVFLVRNGCNLGFAGGVNVGLRFALSMADASFVWILNNDTFVQPNALSHLISAARSLPKAGIVTPTVLMADRQSVIWSRGTARYSRWKGTARLIGYGEPHNRSEISITCFSTQREYPVGAAMLVSMEFIQEAGVLAERYFLYFEELDWVSRAPGDFDFAYVPRSVIYHRGSASILKGPSLVYAQARRLYWLTRSRFLYTRRFDPAVLPIAVFASLLHAAVLTITGRLAAAKLVLLATFTLGSSPSHPKWTKPFSEVL